MALCRSPSPAHKALPSKVRHRVGPISGRPIVAILHSSRRENSRRLKPLADRSRLSAMPVAFQAGPGVEMERYCLEPPRRQVKRVFIAFPPRAEHRRDWRSRTNSERKSVDHSGRIFFPTAAASFLSASPLNTEALFTLDHSILRRAHL